MESTKRFAKNLLIITLTFGMIFSGFSPALDFSTPKAGAAAPSDSIATATTTAATGPSTMRQLVQTSDGTMHSFVQLNTGTVSCGGNSKSGLVWMMSTDSGTSWTCQELISTATNLYASGDVDSSDNIYIVYSTNSVSGSTSSDLFYRKLTKGSGASWTLESAQTVLDSTNSSHAYSYGVVALQGTSRMWLAANYNDGTNRQITVYYSDGLGTAPTWTQSAAVLDSTSSSDGHIPAIARFGSKIGIFYYMTSDSNGSTLRWKYRSDSDGLTSWSDNEMVFMTTVSPSSGYSVVGTETGQVYVAAISTNLFVGYYNGSAWYPSPSIDTTVNANSGISVTTDGTSAYVFYGSKSGLSTPLASYGGIQYYHVYPPSGTADAVTAVKGVSNHGTFNKVWLYGSAADSYTDETTDAANSTSADVAHSGTGRVLSAVNDAAYFGLSEKFDSVSWDVSTNGSGGTASWEYCSAVNENTACTSWSALTLTNSSAPNFTGDGQMIFSSPGDWVSAKVNSEATAYYYVRARASVAYSTGPIGVQTISTPITFGVKTPKTVLSNSIPMVWAENNSTVARVRSNTTSVTTITTTPSTAEELNPPVVTYANNYPVQTNTRSNLKSTVKSSNGTIHTFQNIGPQGRAGTCGAPGLIWLSSSDGGSTWSCKAQLHVVTNSNNIEFYPSAVIDGSDNIYIVYTAISTSGNFWYDLFYRKLSYTDGTWSAGAEQTIAASGVSDGGYHFADIVLEGTTRIWVAARKVTGHSSFTIPVWYSNGLTAAPTWTSSNSSITGSGGSFSYNAPLLVRYGTNIGVIFNDSGSSGQIKWKTRADSDGLTTWSSVATITTNTTSYGSFTAIVDSSNNVYVAVISSTSVYLTYYNGTSWSSVATVSSSAASTAAEAGNFVSLATDNTDIWIFYRETSLGSNFGRLAYKKGVSPFATANFDSTPTNILTTQTALDKVWLYSSAGETYQDETTDATSAATADIQHSGTSKLVSAVNDAIYFGKTSTFDAVSWSAATGTGGVLAWEYYNGSAWAPLTSFVGNAQPEHNFATATVNHITFTPPTNWQSVAVNSEGTAHYYIRARVRQAYTSAPATASQFAATSLPSFAYVLPNASSNLSVMYMDGYRTNSSSSPTNRRIRYIASVANSAPSAPSSLGATAYVNGSAGTDTTPDLSFTLSDGNGADTVKYQIQVDDSADFSSPVVDYTSALAAQGSRTFTVGQAAGSGTYTTGSEGQTLTDGSYYWRVKTFDNGGLFSGYSTANSGSIAFKIDTTAPSDVSSLTASGHSTSTWSNDNTITMTWTAATDAVAGLAGYSYAFDTTSNTTPDTAQDIATVTTVTSGNLADGNSHYFHIRAIDSAGNVGGTVRSGPYYIDTAAPTDPGKPSTTTPTTDSTPTWTWSASTDAGSGLAATPYTVQWSKSSTFASGVSSGTATTHSFTHATGLTDGTWYFRVKAADSAGNESGYSAGGTAIIDTTNPSTPGTPTTTTPTTDSTPTWTWAESTDTGVGLASTMYSFQWSQDATFTSGVSKGTSIIASYTHIVALAVGTWYFRVKSIDVLANESSYSSNGSVTITEPEAETTSSPETTADPAPAATASSEPSRGTTTATARIESLTKTVNTALIGESKIETPLVFKSGNNLIKAPSLAEFVLAPLPTSWQILAAKFPQLELQLNALSVSTFGSLTKLQQTSLDLPGLTKAIGLPSPKQLTELTDEEKAKIPTGFVFAQTGNQQIDFDAKLSIDKTGEPQQLIATVAHKTLFLVTKPSAPTTKVSGQLIFISNETAVDKPSVKLSTLFAPVALASETKVEERLVTLEFNYTDDDQDGIYTANVTTPGTGTYELITRYTYREEKIGDKELRLITIIDPEGYVYEKRGGKEVRIPGATVTLRQILGEIAHPWEAKRFSQENPQITDQTGTYSFLVPEGSYQLVVATPGYRQYESNIFSVEAGKGVHMNIELQPSNFLAQLSSQLNWMYVTLLLALLLVAQYRFRLQFKKRS